MLRWNTPKRSGKRPLIGVTGPDAGGWPAWLFTSMALQRAGARAVWITPDHPLPAERVDGLVLGGGADVTEPIAVEPRERRRPRSKLSWPRRRLDLLFAPAVLLFRRLAGTRTHGIDRERDRLEFELLSHARDLRLPVLGICRGAQLMNLAEGGTLQRHVQAFYEERPQMYTVLPRREVELEDGSKLRDVLGQDRVLVNSLHFHAVAEPGRDVRIVARERGGAAQAIEHTRREFWIGVQWHPEYLPQQEIHQRLFAALVDSARAVSVAGEPGVRRADLAQRRV